MSRVETTHDLTTAQGIFDHVADALIKQGKASTTSPVGNSCRYRSPDGCRCAVGHLIPDDMYSADLEGRSSHHHSLDGKLDDRINHLEHEVLLGSLQTAHDQRLTHSLLSWRACMSDIAQRHKLNDAILKVAA